MDTVYWVHWWTIELIFVLCGLSGRQSPVYGSAQTTTGGFESNRRHNILWRSPQTHAYVFSHYLPLHRFLLQITRCPAALFNKDTC